MAQEAVQRGGRAPEHGESSAPHAPAGGPRRLLSSACGE